MASRKIKGITIEFGADTSKIGEALSKLNNESKALNTKFKDINSLLKFNPRSTELLTQKQATLKDRIENTNKKLKELQELQDNMKAKGIDENSEEYQALRREIIDTKGQLKSYEAQLNKVDAALKVNTTKLGNYGLKMKDQGKTLKEFGTKVQGFGKKMGGIGNKLTLGVTLPVVAMGKKVFDAGSNFEEGMSKVQAISNASASDMALLEKAALDMGRTTKFSATESSEALTYMAMAGWKAEQMVSGLPGVMNLAAASGEELGTVSDIVTDALSAFGMEAKDSSKFADLLASASSNANTNVGMLGESFKYVAPVAGSLGYTAEDTALALGIMANAGIKSSQAGTALRSIMTRLVKPTKESGQAMSDLGIKMTDSQGNMRPFGEVLAELRKKFTGLNKEQKAQYASMIAGKQGMSGFLAIMNATEADFGKLSKATKDYTGEAKRMSDQMEGNTKGTIRKLKSELEGVAIDGFKAMLPSIQKVVAKLRSAVDWFANLDQGTKDTILKLTALAATAGPVTKSFSLITSGVGGAIKGLGSFAKKVGGLATTVAAKGGIVASLKAGVGAIAGFGAKALAIAGPIGATTAAVALLGGAVYGAVKYMSSDAIKEVDLFGDGVSKGTKKAVGAFLELEKEATKSLNQLNWSGQTVSEDIKNDIVGKFSEMKTQVVTKLEEQKKGTDDVLKKMFENSKTYNISEKEETLKYLSETYDEKIKKMNEREAEIKGIMEAASQENRALTAEERTQIDIIKQGMKDDGIRTLSESEAEYKVIMQRISDQGAEISARGAAEVVQRSLEQKENTIANANAEYDERIRIAEEIRAQGGEKAEQQANKIIEEAKRQRDEAVTKATEMHDEVIEKAKQQAEGHVNEVDWETGQVKSKWDILKTNVVTSAQNIWTGVSGWFSSLYITASTTWENMKTAVSNKWHDIKEGIVGKAKGAFEGAKGWFRDIGTNASRKWEEIKGTASRKWGEISGAIQTPIKDAREWVDRKVQGFKDAFKFDWKLPKFKLPRVKVWTEKGLLGLPIPRFKVDWNREGGIFKRPTVLPTMQGMQGFAEPSTGGEAILPLNKMPDLIAEAMDKASSQNKQTVIVYNVLDGKVISKHVTENVNNNLNMKGSRTRWAGGLA